MRTLFNIHKTVRSGTRINHYDCSNAAFQITDYKNFCRINARPKVVNSTLLMLLPQTTDTARETEMFPSQNANRIPNACSTDFERSLLTNIQHLIYSKIAAVFPPYQHRNDFAVGRPFRCNTDKHLLHAFHLLR